MSQYRSVDGHANDWHLVHLGRQDVVGVRLVPSLKRAVEVVDRERDDRNLAAGVVRHDLRHGHRLGRKYGQSNGECSTRRKAHYDHL